jgi:hypothetical protein
MVAGTLNHFKGLKCFYLQGQAVALLLALEYRRLRQDALKRRNCSSNDTATHLRKHESSGCIYLLLRCSVLCVYVVMYAVISHLSSVPCTTLVLRSVVRYLFI